MKAKINITNGNSVGVQPLFLKTLLTRVYNINGIFTDEHTFNTIKEAKNILFQCERILKDIHVDHVYSDTFIMLRSKAKLEIEKIK